MDNLSNIFLSSKPLDTLRKGRVGPVCRAGVNWAPVLKLCDVQVATLRDQMKVRESKLQKELDDAQASSDCVALELRRRLDKIDMSYQDKLDALSEK